MSPFILRGRSGIGSSGRLAHCARLSLALAAVGLLTVPGFAQTTGSVRGRVVDGATRQPLNGAQVYVAGTQRGALTNASGDYLILSVDAGAATVRVEMIGYRAMEQAVTVPAGGSATADFELQQSAIGLDEIVVTGTAGRTTKRAIGNAVSSVKAAEVTESIPVADVQELLQARTPGLTIVANSGQAGTSSKFRIRGAGSVYGALEPVIYVDGIRVTSGTQDGYSTSNGVVQGTNPLDAINPNDIESIEVIKGPAAATLYGADAAGGVIQIITKKGRPAEGIQWTMSLEGGESEWHLDRPQTYWLCSPAEINSSSWPGCNGIDPNAPDEQRLLIDSPLDNDYECNWTEQCIPTALRTGDIWGFNLSARGGGEAFNYYISAEKSDEQGVFHNNFSRRTSGRANFGFVPSQKLNFNVNVGYARNHIRMPLNNNSSNSVLRNAFRGRPGTSGGWQLGYRGFSPEISNQYDNQTEMERTTIGLTANYNPVSWLQNKLTLGMDKNDRVNAQFYRLDETGRAPWGAVEATGQMSRYLPVDHVWTLDYAGTASFDVSPAISSAFSAGVQLNKRTTESHEAIGEGLVANKLNLVGSAAITRADQDFEEQTSLGFFVQEQVGWRDRLFATAAIRVDDNSAFGQDFSLVVYPKASLSYVISDEDFFDVPFIDDLKLRGAWGQAGNAPEPFSADRTLEPVVTTVGDVAVNYLQFESYGNPDLKAETGQEFELGFDASFLEGRVGAELTYYNQTTKDALISVPNPPSTGYRDSNRGTPRGPVEGGEHLINIGEVSNSGVELLLTGTPVLLDGFAWDITASLATNSNELVSFGGVREEISFGAFATVQKHIEGYPLGGYWAVDVERDAQGNPVIVNGEAVVSTTEEFMGPMLPTREIALTNTITLFNSLRLYANLDYKGGNYAWCAMCSVRNRVDRNTWEYNRPGVTAEERAVLRSLQTKRWIQEADFIKLRELSATYSLPSAWVSRFRASNASVTLSGRNLWMWTEYGDGSSDPEVTFYSRENFNHLDYGSAPMTRRLMASMRVSF